MPTTLDPDFWYQIYYTPLQSYLPAAQDINTSGTAGLSMLKNGTNKIESSDRWRVLSTGAGESILVSESLGDGSYLAAYSTGNDTKVRVAFRDTNTDVSKLPAEGRWSLVPSTSSDSSFRVSNAANGTNYLLDVSDLIVKVTTGDVGKTTPEWTFSSVNKVSSTTSTTASEAHTQLLH